MAAGLVNVRVISVLVESCLISFAFTRTFSDRQWMVNVATVSSLGMTLQNSDGHGPDRNLP